MATLPWKGATQSNGSPKTEYEYDVKCSNRTMTSVHVVVKVKVRMTSSSSYFSFAIYHHCQVSTSKETKKQTTKIKDDRHMWGHQWAGSYSQGSGKQKVDWKKGTYDYDGSNWHGWYTVFDGDVKIGETETKVSVVPCITRPNIANPANALEITNWKGKKGVWNGLNGNDYYTGYYAKKECPQDAAFLNNKGKLSLADDKRLHCGAAPKPGKVTGLTYTPKWINVEDQKTQKITAKWSQIPNASRYVVYCAQKSSGGAGRSEMSVAEVSTTSVSFIAPPVYPDWQGRFVDGDRLDVTVVGVSSAGVWGDRDIVWKNQDTDIVFHESPSYPPYSAYVVGRHASANRHLFTDMISGIAMHSYDKGRGFNEVLLWGENVTLYYYPPVNGSYPVSKLQVVRVKDGYVAKEWSVSSGQHVGVRGNMWYFINFKFPPVLKGRPVEEFEIRAFDTLGREVKSDADRHVNGRYRFTINYYGNATWVRVDGRWRRGLLFVRSNGKWKEAKAVYRIGK